MKLKFFRTKFYIQFIYYRLRILIDCPSGKTQLFLAELLRLSNIVLHTTFEMPGKCNVVKLKTIFGTFNLIGNIYSYSIASPAFERPDIEELIHKIKRSLQPQKHILFLDIGANIGFYSIGVSKRVHSNNLKVIAFEPDPVYHQLLLDNVKINKVLNCDIRHIALGDSKKNKYVKREPEINNKNYSPKALFYTRTLDSIFTTSFYNTFDEIYVKIDTDGLELEVLDGAKRLFQIDKKVTILVEDFIQPLIFERLCSLGCIFVQKLTPYNSFWVKPAKTSL